VVVNITLFMLSFCDGNVGCVVYDYNVSLSKFEFVPTSLSDTLKLPFAMPDIVNVTWPHINKSSVRRIFKLTCLESVRIQ
jgi:hypothetical protein